MYKVAQKVSHLQITKKTFLVGIETANKIRIPLQIKLWI